MKVVYCHGSQRAVWSSRSGGEAVSMLQNYEYSKKITRFSSIPYSDLHFFLLGKYSEYLSDGKLTATNAILATKPGFPSLVTFSHLISDNEVNV